MKEVWYHANVGFVTSAAVFMIIQKLLKADEKKISVFGLSRCLDYWAPVYFSFNRNGMAVADR